MSWRSTCRKSSRQLSFLDWSLRFVLELILWLTVFRCCWKRLFSLNVRGFPGRLGFTCSKNQQTLEEDVVVRFSHGIAVLTGFVPRLGWCGFSRSCLELPVSLHSTGACFWPSSSSHDGGADCTAHGTYTYFCMTLRGKGNELA